MNSPWLRVEELREECSLYAFSRHLHCPKGTQLLAHLSADSCYKLLVNGQFVVEGPCHGTRYAKMYETIDLTPYLVEGENHLLVQVFHATDGHVISLYRERKAAFWFVGEVAYPDGKTETIHSDTSWEVSRYANRKVYSYPGFIPSVPPSEEVDGEDVLVAVPTSLYHQAPPEQRAFNQFGVRGTYPLTPRPIPHHVKHPQKPMLLVKTDKNGADYDAGQYETAYVHLSVKGKAGTEVRLIYAECKVNIDETGKVSKHLRDDPEGFVQGAYDGGVAKGTYQGGLKDTIRFTEDGTLTFDTFYYRSFRYIRMETTAPVEIQDFSFTPYYYPMGDEGRVTCSDDAYNKMWDISRHTVMCCAHDNYVDCPYYEQQQYDMDSGLQMLFTLRMTGDSALPRKSISDLAASQLPDGMLQANYPSVVVQVIPSFSLYWVLMLREYLRYTGDLPFVRSMMGTMEKVFSAFDNILTEDGLVGTTVYWPFVDWAPEWGDTGVPDGGVTEPLTMYTLLYAATLKAGAEVCESLGRTGLAAEYRARADKANAAANTHCFDANRGLYRNTPYRNAYAQQCVLWAVLSGAVEGEAAREMMEKAMTEDISISTFSMNYYLFRALEKTGLYDKYAPKVFEGWHRMLDWHCTTWCENPDNPRSECHGWSSAPIFELSSAILGVYPTANGMTEITVSPRAHWFDTIDGTVPTPHGLVRVSWAKEGDAKRMVVQNPAPDKIRMFVCTPHGKIEQTTAEGQYTI